MSWFTKGIDCYVYVNGPGLSIQLEKKDSDKQFDRSYTSSFLWNKKHLEIGGGKESVIHDGFVQFTAYRNGIEIHKGKLRIGNFSGDINSDDLAEMGISPIIGEDYCLNFGLYDADSGTKFSYDWKHNSFLKKSNLPNAHQLYISFTHKQDNWQQKLFDECSKPIIEKLKPKNLFFPGSHDAGMHCYIPSVAITNIANTQINDVSTQLEMGARYFDFRPGRLKANWQQILKEDVRAMQQDEPFWKRMLKSWPGYQLYAFAALASKYSAYKIIETLAKDEYQHIHSFIPGETYRSFLAGIFEFLNKNEKEIVIIELSSSGFLSNLVDRPTPGELQHMLNSVAQYGIGVVDESGLDEPVESLIDQNKRVIILDRVRQEHADQETKKKLRFVESYSGYYETTDAERIPQAIRRRINNLPIEHVKTADAVYIAMQITPTATSGGIQRSVKGSNIFTSPLRATKAQGDYLGYDFLTKDLLNDHANEAVVLAGNDFYDNAFTETAYQVNRLKLGLVDSFPRSTSNRLGPDHRLLTGEEITSPNGHFKLLLSAEKGNLILLNRLGIEVWNSNTTNGEAAYATVQAKDGDLVICNKNHDVLWSAGNDKSFKPRYQRVANSELVLKDNGTLSVFAPSGALNWTTDVRRYDRYPINERLQYGGFESFSKGTAIFTDASGNYLFRCSTQENTSNKYNWHIYQLTLTGLTEVSQGELDTYYDQASVFYEGDTAYLYAQSSKADKDKAYPWFIATIQPSGLGDTQKTSSSRDHFFDACTTFSMNGKNYLYGQAASDNYVFLSEISRKGFESPLLSTGDWKRYYSAISIYQKNGDTYLFAHSTKKKGDYRWFTVKLTEKGMQEEEQSGSWKRPYGQVGIFVRNGKHYMYGQAASDDGYGQYRWFICELLQSELLMGTRDYFYDLALPFQHNGQLHLFTHSSARNQWFISGDIHQMVE
ncbi:MAG: hypothetical protein AAFO03_20095 [Bacteroidota bacterium]